MAVKTMGLPERSVRSTSHAAGTPKIRAMASAVAENPTVFSSTETVKGSPNTSA